MSAPNPICFDTLHFVKRLSVAGMPPGQAEALAAEQVDMLYNLLATKQDLAAFATKEDLARFATKEDLAALAARLDGFATKEDLARFATKEDLARFATKEDLAALAARLDGFATKEDLAEVRQEVAVLKAKVDLLMWAVSAIGGGVLVLIFRTFWPV